MRSALSLALLTALLSAPVQSQNPDVASFSSVALRGGGEITLSQGRQSGIVLTEGSREYSGIGVDPSGTLVVRRCARPCPRGYRLRARVTVPAIAALSVADGGTIYVDGGFPPQPRLTVRVEQGGAIDARSLSTAVVDAVVQSGGRILVRPTRALSAQIVDGGLILHWGTTAVRRSVRGGGSITRGAPRDFARPLAAFGPSVPDLPPLPPIPPLPRN